MSYSKIDFTYGVSFWVFIAGIVCFIVIIIYEQFSLEKYEQQKMILELIEKERNVAQTLNGMDLSSEGEAYI